MTGPVTIDARTPGYDALMQTLRATRTVQASTFDSRTIEQVARQNQADAKTDSKADMR